MKLLSVLRASRSLGQVLLVGASLAILIPQGDARAACVDNGLLPNNNCEDFNTPSDNQFFYNVFVGGLGTASQFSAGSVQVVLDGAPALQAFTVTDLTLTIQGVSKNLGTVSFNSNGASGPSWSSSIFNIDTEFTGSVITTAVLSGTLSATAPSVGTIFEGGIYYNSNAATSSGLLDIGIAGGAAKGSSLYQSSYDPTAVPGPLPVLGAGVAFGFSRRLRRRISSS